MEPVAALNLGGVEYPLTLTEARDLVRWLHMENPKAPGMHVQSIHAAIFLERLLEDQDGENPPMTWQEAAGVLSALSRKSNEEGLTEREEALSNALFLHLTD